MNARALLIDTYHHMPPGSALQQLGASDAERRVEGGPHSIAEIVAHMAFWQDWFCLRCEGVAELMASAIRGGPAVAPGAWPEVRDRFAAGLERAASFEDRSDRLVAPAIDFPPLGHYTIREAIVHIAQHNSHHLGQVILLRQLMGLWPPPSGSWTW